MSQISENIYAVIPAAGDYMTSTIHVYSTVGDMSNSQYSNDYIEVEGTVLGERRTCYVAVTKSNTNDAYKAHGTTWVIDDKDGTPVYVMKEPYLPESSSEPDTHTYTYRQYDAFGQISGDSSLTKALGDVTYMNDTDYPWNQILTADWYKTVYQVTRDDGEVRYCYSQSWNDPIADGWWHKDYISAQGKDGDGFYYWECANCYLFVNGYQSTYAGGYDIEDNMEQWDFNEQDNYPAASRQTQS